MTESTRKTSTNGNGVISWENAKGHLHRKDGPAFEGADGHKIWYIHGNLHREDGPAISYPDGDKSWYLQDRKVTEEEHRVLVKGPPYANLAEYNTAVQFGKHRHALILVDSELAYATDTSYDEEGSINDLTDLLKDMAPREMLMQALELLGLKYEDI